jgi:hypothetical protein
MTTSRRAVRTGVVAGDLAVLPERLGRTAISIRYEPRGR